VPVTEAGVDQQRSASGHESDGEHVHRAKCPARRAVCVPAADSVPPIAVFAKDVQGELNRVEERKCGKGHGAAREPTNEAFSSGESKENQRDYEAGNQDEL
jgi:hypothetical protein